MGTKAPLQISLALSGSGFLAMIHAGAVCALRDSGAEIVEVAGTSGGSILAAAVAAGLTNDEIRQMALDSDMSKLLRWSPSGMFAKRKYWCNGKDLYAWLDAHFKGAKLGQAKIPVRIVSTDYREGQSFVFNRTLTPDVPFALACRASSAIPVVYAPVLYGSRMLIDGGTLDNCPLNELGQPRSIKIGVDVMSGSSKNSDTSILKYASGLIGMLLSSSEAAQILMATQRGARIVKVHTPNNFLNNHATPEQRLTMFSQGYEAMAAELRAIK